jgi:hypothetical protein
MSEINLDVEKLPKLREHEKTLKAFIESVAHEGYIEGCRAELTVLDNAIVNFEPKAADDFVELSKLYGQRRVLLTQEYRFKDAYEVLKNRIAQVELSINSRKN